MVFLICLVVLLLIVLNKIDFSIFFLYFLGILCFGDGIVDGNGTKRLSVLE